MAWENDVLSYFLYGLILLVGMFIGVVNGTLGRAKISRRFTGKNYGIIRLTTKGKRIAKTIVNLDDPIYPFGKDKLFNPQKSNPHCVYVEDEVPVIHYDEVDSKPLILERDKTDEGVKYFKDPQAMMGAFLAHEAAMRKEHAMEIKSINERMKLAVYVAAGASVISIILVWNLNGTLGDITKEIAKVAPAVVSQLKDLAKVPVV